MFIQKNLKYLLKINMLSYRQVSKESGVSIRAISNIMTNSNVKVTLNTVINLANFFEISLDDFVYKDLENLHGHDVHIEKEKE